MDFLRKITYTINILEHWVPFAARAKDRTMKTAQTVDGKTIIASKTAPKEAVCPYCGGILVLRSRRTMNGEKASYYWRHQNNKNPNCSGRARPV
jgi:hypothetical protein